jgi:PhnB protein
MTRQRPLGLGAHIFVQDADAAVAFYTEAFGAAELVRQQLPDGRVLFVELAVGPDKLLLSEEVPELKALAPPTVGGSPVMLLLELDDVDAAFAHTVELGATVELPVGEMFWGERYAVVVDPFGHRWSLCTRRELLSPDEVAERVPADPSAAPPVVGIPEGPSATVTALVPPVPGRSAGRTCPPSRTSRSTTTQQPRA